MIVFDQEANFYAIGQFIICFRRI